MGREPQAVTGATPAQRGGNVLSFPTEVLTEQEGSLCAGEGCCEPFLQVGGGLGRPKGSSPKAIPPLGEGTIQCFLQTKILSRMKGGTSSSH